MKTYAGVPSAPPVVMVTSDTGMIVPLDGGPFAWGKNPHPDVQVRALALAKAILGDVLGPSQTLKANRLATRFMWRTIKVWNADQPFQITDEEVLQHVADIAQVETETAGMRARTALESGPSAFDGGIGVGGGRITWTKTEKKQ